MRELSLLEYICDGKRRWPERVAIPPGDDLAAVRFGDVEVLMGTDQIADGVHFQLGTTSLAAVARKALTRNLSDVAAMAAQPVCALVATMLPREFPQARAIELVDHLNAVAEAYACPLVGGDVGGWDGPLQLTVTIVAESQGIDPVRRSGARPDDAICVSGSLGGSFERVDGKIHHLDFEPRIALARRLAGDPRTRPHCMIDLSDGLSIDLGHLCQASGLGAEVEVDRLPIALAAHEAVRRDGRPLWQHAAGDGEDYELLFTASEAQLDAVLGVEVEGVSITCIGRMVSVSDEPAVRFRFSDGTVQGFGHLGWEHGDR